MFTSIGLMVAQTETRWVSVVGELGWVSMCWRVNVCLKGEEEDFLFPNNDIGLMSTEWPHATPQDICHTIWEQTARRNLEIVLFPPKPQLGETKQMLVLPASLSFPLRVQGQDGEAELSARTVCANSDPVWEFHRDLATRQNWAGRRWDRLPNHTDALVCGTHF